MGEIKKAPCRRAADGTLVWAPRQMQCRVDKQAFVISNQGVLSAKKALWGISS